MCVRVCVLRVATLSSPLVYKKELTPKTHLMHFYEALSQPGLL